MRSWKKRKPSVPAKARESSDGSPGADDGSADERSSGERFPDAPSSDERKGPSAYDRALGLLSRREHSARELARKLVDRGHEPDEAAAAIDAARERSYQSDARFAESVVRRRAAAGYGRRYVESELASHGIDARHHRDAIDAIDWLEVAVEALERKRCDLSTREGRMKAAQFLARRGFDAEVARKATH